MGECLDHLVTLMPKMKRCSFLKGRGCTGIVVAVITVLVNDEAIGAEGLAKEVNDGDELYIKMILQ